MNKISGILPIRNGEAWIARNLPRILTNLSQDDELVVVDDGSVDASYSLVMSFAKNDSRISLHRTKGIGLVDALNLAISNAKFEWLARFDIDDFYSRERLNYQRRAIQNETVVIFCDYRVLRNGTINLGLIPSPLTDSAIRVSLFRSARTAHPSALINKAALLKCGGYEGSDFPAEDLGLWTRISEQGQLISIPHEGLLYNMRGGSISRENRALIAEKRMRILQSYKDHFEMDSVLEKLSETINLYEGTSYGRERLLLHYWDLLHPLSQELLGKYRTLTIRKSLSRLLLSPSSLIPILDLGYYRCLRSFYK